jgi:amino acid adenylation domain-containing protein
MSVLETIRKVAVRRPRSTALRTPQGDVSYAEFIRRVDGLAHSLRRRGIGPDSRVAIHLERSAEMIIAIFGSLASGAAYVPLATENPAERLREIVQDSQCSLLLSRADGEFLAESNGIERLDPSAWAMDGPSNPAFVGGPAYLIYTSGSTGKPKGVVIEHASLENYLAWAVSELPFTGGGAPLFGSISFDLSVTICYPPLMKGEPLILLPPIQGARALAESLVTGHHYSYVKITPSHWAFLDADQRAALGGSTDLLMFGGERLTFELVRQARRDNPSLAVMNHYGPTEATVGCCVYRVPASLAGTSVPIGQPISGVEANVLREDLTPAEPGEPGELFIGGRALARGYWGRPDLTAKAFVELPDGRGGLSRWYRTGDLVQRLTDTNIEYLGRADDQVKILGHRVEPGEIEQALRSHPGVQEAVVLAAERSGAIELIAGVTVSDGSLTEKELRRFARLRLPSVMVPTRIIRLDSFPVTSSGKLDRQLILKLAELCAPETCETSIEDLVAGKFREALGLPHVEPADDFFELGGDSMATVEITVWASEHFQITLEPAALFEFPTTQSLADRIRRLSSSGR